MTHKLISVSERARRYLVTQPPAVSGCGGHDATFRAACVLVNGFGLSVDEARPLLCEWNTGCLPPWNDAELEHKLVSAAATPSDRPSGYLLGDAVFPAVAAATPTAPLKSRLPAPDPERIAEVVKNGPGAADLTLLSPGPLDGEDAGHNCEPIVDALFADTDALDPLLCVGKSSREFATRPLSAWLASGKLADFSLIVPARMTAKQGRTKEGKLSDHTLENTGSRVAVVVEFDAGTADEHAARLWHLGSFSPLALVVHSGSKSLHGWFPATGVPPEDVHRFMRYAASLGADPALFRNPSQFVRLPGGTRDGGCRQSVFYWNPAALVNLEGGSR